MEWIRRNAGLLAAGGCAAAVCLLFTRQVVLLAELVAGGAVVAFLLGPLADWIALRLKVGRGLSLLLAYLCAALGMGAALFLLVPALIRQVGVLVGQVPALLSAAKEQAKEMIRRLAAWGYRIQLPEFPWEKAFSSVQPLLDGTASAANSLFSGLGRFSLMLVLSFYFLRDRESLCIQLEMAAPSGFRGRAVRIAHAVRREMSTYLRGQAMIALLVGALSAMALLLVGVQGFLVLGLLVGLLNMIPYFGPILGAIPVLLMALAQGSVKRALLAAGALLLVQQVDNIFISPRVMGSVTGLHPAVVLLAITVGGSFGGLPGMLFAVPVTLIFRVISRNWASRPVSAADNRTKY